MNKSLSRSVICVGLIASLTACDQKPPAAPDTAKAQVNQSAMSGKKVAEEKSEFELAGLEHVVVVGEPGEAVLRVLPGKGLKINPEYPWKLDLIASESSPEVVAADMTIKKDKMKLEAAGAKIPVAVKLDQGGDYEIAGSLNLSVCEKGNEARCLWFRDEPVTIKVSAKPKPTE